MARTTWHLPRRPKTISAVAPAAFMLVVGISGKPKQWRLYIKGQVDANGLFPNPTPDGKMPGESKSSPREIQNYLGRISGPLLDRIDLHIEVQINPVEQRSGNSAQISLYFARRTVRFTGHFAFWSAFRCLFAIGLCAWSESMLHPFGHEVSQFPRSLKALANISERNDFRQDSGNGKLLNYWRLATEPLAFGKQIECIRLGHSSPD